MSQHSSLIEQMSARPLMRAFELREAGIQATTISRAVQNGEITRVSRGLYQLVDDQATTHQSLAEVSRKIPKGTICMVSALSYHELTDQMPRAVWIAIGNKDWAPELDYPRTRIMRFSRPYLDQGIERHIISGIEVPVYSIPKTLADLFRNLNLIDRSVAIEALKAAIRTRKASPAEIAAAAKLGGAWKTIQPYLEAVSTGLPI
ncbi:type IV toxin-antitoxin system AbiEi family antitoxin domain-containing protein (plasmid) [Asticcacaulis sp. DW145]|uniref:type IV toxin-antitoxin system AbiEi family antitoxin domain-containing protein n=1 Tax=Asticcacaulis sp. DW145 TaxID=3095608 RepID=UPI00308DF3F4|nr:type IV toxin-antitoxin system AbiEi family antitoxin domain-containing protein [Asticcacaulis sp. DW145]